MQKQDREEVLQLLRDDRLKADRETTTLVLLTLVGAALIAIVLAMLMFIACVRLVDQSKQEILKKLQPWSRDGSYESVPDEHGTMHLPEVRDYLDMIRRLQEEQRRQKTQLQQLSPAREAEQGPG